MARATEWFKVIKDGKFLGVVTDQSFARYSEKSGRVHICNAIKGQYLVLNDRYYRDDWMLPVSPESYAEFENATVVSISEKEFDILSKVEYTEPINVDELINAEPEDIHKKASTIEEIATVEAVRTNKLKELETACSFAITDGFSLVLSDGASHHFSMSLEDQINLMHLETALNNGDDMIYHADGELAQFYSEEDAKAIVIGARRWRQYNITLYNSLKNWINSIDDIEAIDAIRYDSEIPDEYCTEVLKELSKSF